MRTMRKVIICLLCCLLLAVISSPVQAQQGRDPEFEQAVLERLEAINPEAVPFFEQATQSMDAGDLQAAKLGFERVLFLAPDFPDALRRISYIEMQLGLIEDALAHAQKAYDLEPLVYNKSNLAWILISTESPQNIVRASTLAKEALQEDPEDVKAYDVLMYAAALQNDNEALRAACEALFRLVPEYPIPHVYYAALLADEGKWEKAEAELLKARELGVPAEAIDQILSDTGIARQALLYRSARWSAYIVAGWLLGMVSLFLLGLLLSKVTLSAVRRAQSRAHTNPSRPELFVRSIYRGVIALTSGYFYISIPILIALVLAVGAGLLYAVFSLGSVPVRLVAFIAIAVLFTLFSILRGVFTRIRQQEPGRPLLPEEAPALWKLTQDVADQLGTQPIQAIYLTPGTEIAVFERGGVLRKRRGQGKRSLLLGLGVLSGMTQGQLKSILAHEYGHFTGKDTAGGDLAFRVQRSIQMIAINLAISGQARWYNPAWWFVRGYYNLFQRVSLGASRLQEILADRYAAAAYGARNFIDGLRHVIRQSLTFDMQVNYEVNQAVQQNAPIQNLYALPLPSTGEEAQKLEEAYQKALSQPTGAFDSHPSPAERFQLVEQLSLPEKFSGLDDDRPAWELLPDAESLQSEMTAQVQARLDERKKEA
jgi:Zn-dependent protease with chaperone function